MTACLRISDTIGMMLQGCILPTGAQTEGKGSAWLTCLPLFGGKSGR